VYIIYNYCILWCIILSESCLLLYKTLLQIQDTQIVYIKISYAQNELLHVSANHEVIFREVKYDG